VGGVCAGLFLHRGDVNAPDLYRNLAPGSVTSSGKGTRRQRFVLPFDRSRASTRPSPADRRGRNWGTGADGGGWWWKAVRHDLASARQLSSELHEVFDEARISDRSLLRQRDRAEYPGVFDSGNGIFEPLWNRRYVDHVQITGAESIGGRRVAALITRK